MNRTSLRRQDRAVNDEAWIETFLHRGAAMTFAFSQDDQPFILTTLYAYDPQRHAVYFHGASQGRTPELVQANPRVAAITFQMERLLPAERALNFSVEYASVVLFGEVHRVEEATEALHGLDLLMAKYAPHLQPDKDYDPAQPHDLKATAVYRLDIREWAGKQNQAREDFPGAYAFDALPFDEPRG